MSHAAQVSDRHDEVHECLETRLTTTLKLVNKHCIRHHLTLKNCLWAMAAHKTLRTLIEICITVCGSFDSNM